MTGTNFALGFCNATPVAPFLASHSTPGTCDAAHASARAAARRVARVTCHAGHDHGHGGHGTAAAGLDAAGLAALQAPLAPGTWEGGAMDAEQMVSAVKFNDAGLVPAVAQQYDTGEVLMMAWMSAESIRETLRGGRAVYYSRSRRALWRKGDTSGQIQVLCDVVLDCDGDTVLLKVDQLGVACHTGRRTCFYTAFRPELGGAPLEVHAVLMDPNELYGGAAS